MPDCLPGEETECCGPEWFEAQRTELEILLLIELRVVAALMFFLEFCIH